MNWPLIYRIAKRALIPVIGVDTFARCRLLTRLAAKAGKWYMKREGWHPHYAVTGPSRKER